MGLRCSAFCDTPSIGVGDPEIVARIGAICDEFETYGYSHVGAAPRHQGTVVNAKKVGA